jgi:antitoxin HigA-1
MLTTKRKPATVGEILLEEFMQPLDLTQGAVTEAMGVRRKHVNELCNNRRSVTAATALILARVFGNTPDLWLNAQRPLGGDARSQGAGADRAGQTDRRCGVTSVAAVSARRRSLRRGGRRKSAGRRVTRAARRAPKGTSIPVSCVIGVVDDRRDRKHARVSPLYPTSTTSGPPHPTAIV